MKTFLKKECHHKVMQVLQDKNSKMSEINHTFFNKDLNNII